jgi:hypothetical protein
LAEKRWIHKALAVVHPPRQRSKHRVKAQHKWYEKSFSRDDFEQCTWRQVISTLRDSFRRMLRTQLHWTLVFNLAALLSTTTFIHKIRLSIAKATGCVDSTLTPTNAATPRQCYQTTVQRLHSFNKPVVVETFVQASILRRSVPLAPSLPECLFKRDMPRSTQDLRATDVQAR